MSLGIPGGSLEGPGVGPGEEPLGFPEGPEVVPRGPWGPLTQTLFSSVVQIIAGTNVSAPLVSKLSFPRDRCEGPLEIPERSPEVPGESLGSPWRFLESPWRVPGGSLDVSGVSLGVPGGPWRVPGGSLGATGEP